MDINNTHNNINNKITNQENTPSSAKPYMGNLTSSQIGNMARVGALGGEMVKRMVQQQEEKLAEEYNNNNQPLS